MLNMFGREKYTDALSHGVIILIKILQYRKTSSFQDTADVISIVKGAFPHQSDGSKNKISRLLFQVLVRI